MLSHEELEDLASGYVLLALEPEERRAFEEHLPTCALCRQRVTQLQEVAETFPLLTEEREPPPSLRARVLAVAESGASQPAVYRRGWAWWQRLARPAVLEAALAVLLVAVAGLAFWNLRLQQGVDTMERRLDRTYEAITIMGQAEQWWPATPSAAAPGATGTLAYAPRQQAACLVVWGLAPPGDRTYQVWIVDDGVPTRLGNLWPMESGLWIIIPRDVSRLDGVLVTLEEAGSDLVQPRGSVMVNVPLSN